MIGRHFHGNIKVVQTAMCKDNNNSKSRAATNVKYIYIYIVKRFSNPRKESTPCDGDGKRK